MKHERRIVSLGAGFLVCLVLLNFSAGVSYSWSAEYKQKSSNDYGICRSMNFFGDIESMSDLFTNDSTPNAYHNESRKTYSFVRASNNSTLSNRVLVASHGFFNFDELSAGINTTSNFQYRDLDEICVIPDRYKVFKQNLNLKILRQEDLIGRYRIGLERALKYFQRDASGIHGKTRDVDLKLDSPDDLRGHFEALELLVTWSLGQGLSKIASIKGTSEYLEGDEQILPLEEAMGYLKAAAFSLTRFYEISKGAKFLDEESKKKYRRKVANHITRFTGILGSRMPPGERTGKSDSYTPTGLFTTKFNSEKKMKESPAFFYLDILENIIDLQKLNNLCIDTLQDLDSAKIENEINVKPRYLREIYFSGGLINEISNRYLKKELEKPKYLGAINFTQIEKFINQPHF